MASETKISKKQAVQDYLSEHPEAAGGEIAAALNDQGIEISKSHAANIKSALKKANGSAKKVAVKKRRKKKKAAVEAPVHATVEKASNGAITLDQVKKVSHAMQKLGGYERMAEVLDLIKELGSVKKFKDLAEAMSMPGYDDIPF
jgi:hypothetical protein